MATREVSQRVRPLVIIPAAGFGRRVGSPEAKELFLRPDGTRLIDLGLQCASERAWPAHVITRTEKTSLVRYLKQSPNTTVQLIGATYDWPETILQSEPFWHEWNLVFLPDMDFKPRKILEEFAFEMSVGDVDVITANHLVEDASHWGLLWPDSATGLTVGEKVPIEKSEKRQAWGLYAFKKSAGRKLLEAQLDSCRDHRLRQLPIRSKALKLSAYLDLTRPSEA